MAALTRRRRLLWITAGTAAVFLLAAGLVAWRWSRPKAAYQPGEEIEGITSDLTRPIPGDYPRVVFTDVAREAGIAFRHFSGKRTSQLPEDMGSGAAWGPGSIPIRTSWRSAPDHRRARHCIATIATARSPTSPIARASTRAA